VPRIKRFKNYAFVKKTKPRGFRSLLHSKIPVMVAYQKGRERGDEGRYTMDNKKINTFILLLLSLKYIFGWSSQEE
jgi:hypothetical protein